MQKQIAINILHAINWYIYIVQCVHVYKSMMTLPIPWRWYIFRKSQVSQQ